MKKQQQQFKTLKEWASDLNFTGKLPRHESNGLYSESEAITVLGISIEAESA